MLHEFLVDFTDDDFDALLASRQEDVVIALVLEGYLVAVLVQVAELITLRKGLENGWQGREEFCEFLFVRGLEDVDFLAEDYLEDHG